MWKQRRFQHDVDVVYDEISSLHTKLEKDQKDMKDIISNEILFD